MTSREPCRRDLSDPDAPARYFVPHLLLHLSILLFSFFFFLGVEGGREQIRGSFVFLTAEAR